MKDKEVVTFVELLHDIDLIDLCSLGILMEVPNNEDFEDYIGDLLYNFYNRSKPEKQALVDLVRNISRFRKNYRTYEDLSKESVERRVAELKENFEQIIQDSQKPSILKRILGKK